MNGSRRTTPGSGTIDDADPAAHRCLRPAAPPSRGSTPWKPPACPARRSARWTRCSPRPKVPRWWTAIDDPERGGTSRLVRAPLRFDGQSLVSRMRPPILGEHDGDIAETVNASERWKAALEARAIPQALIDAAPASPWGFPRELFAARGAQAAGADVGITPTIGQRALEALPRRRFRLGCRCGRRRHVASPGAQGRHDHRRRRTTRHARGLRVDRGIRRRAGDHRGRTMAGGGTATWNRPTWPFRGTPSTTSPTSGRSSRRWTTTREIVWCSRPPNVIRWAGCTDLWRRFHGLYMPDEPRVGLALEVMGEIGVEPHRQDRPGGDDDPGGRRVHHARSGRSPWCGPACA